jgi:hypothetical protein
MNCFNKQKSPVYKDNQKQGFMAVHGDIITLPFNTKKNGNLHERVDLNGGVSPFGLRFRVAASELPKPKTVRSPI